MDFLLTWHTYGTWLPGDPRGWDSRMANRYETPRPSASAGLVAYARSVQAQEAFVLSAVQRGVVDETIRDHCEIRGWTLHALNVRTNHVHVVVYADRPPERVVGECKAYSSRRLRAETDAPERIWTRHASTRRITTEASFRRAVEYVLHEQ